MLLAMKNSKKKQRSYSGQLLDSLRVNDSVQVNTNEYPFTVPLIRNLKEISFTTPVTFFVGENGSGKSTILEAIAYKAGFGVEGGSKNISFNTSDKKNLSYTQTLADLLTLSWNSKPFDGYFFRAETFFNVANYLDVLATEGGQGEVAYHSYGGKSLHAQSHGESFLSFFNNRLGKGGFFVLDEPEAALSPQRQLSLLVIINELCKKSDAQFIIATHSPLLLAYPNSVIYSCDSVTLTQVNYTDTDHYQITKSFLNNPESFLHNLFNE
ncbi:ABC transporter ATP-binding protein [Candidatus Dependentiae bacterium Noda2021]|nr:ABC transporter ATP-binding protein [Candidatus Dependentiae bacterium Noda2021]